MKILSYNVNGIRAALNKGFSNWLDAARPDVICLQEIKAMESQVETSVFLRNWATNLLIGFLPNKKGYSGVAILSKNLNLRTSTFGTGMDHMDFEGRVTSAPISIEVSVMSSLPAFGH